MTPNRAMLLIAAAVLVWGVFLAVGAYYFNHNVWRFVMVMGCVGGFLAFWGIMLAVRSARLKRQKSRRLGPRDAC
jgi:hypothetical protein